MNPNVGSYKQIYFPVLLTFAGSTCDTFNDAGSNLEPFPKFVTGLTLLKAEKAIEQIQLIGSYAPLEKLIFETFSSADALNASFSYGLSKLSYSQPNIDFQDLSTFYVLISTLPSTKPMQLILSTSLALLKRPHYRLTSPSHILFLLIILENPALYSTSIFPESNSKSIHYEILERVIGILAHSSKRVRHHLLNWLLRFPPLQFQQKVELFNAFITHRLIQHYWPTKKQKSKQSWSLFHSLNFPSLRKNSSILQPTHQISSSAQQQADGPSQAQEKKEKSGSRSSITNYGNDWRIAACARLQAMFFHANLISKKIPISVFYNTLIDYIEITYDFKMWEQQSPMSGEPANFNNLNSPQQNPLFTFCQYPFMLSMGGKTQILEFDAHRHMELQAQESFLKSLNSQIPIRPYLHIKVGRKDLLQDSFDVLEANGNELKKAIRVEFIGEPGIDVGGLRKEWFLLLMRNLFDPAQKLFIQDDVSKYYWFDTSSSQPLKYYKLAGIILGLALYNSTILGGGFAPVLFSRLLGFPYALRDFTKMWPVYGVSLRKILDYEGDDFEVTFGLCFALTRKENGMTTEHLLLPGGSEIPVTKSNRKDYVNKTVKYFLETSVEQQFEQLQEGFHSVAGSNALTLFQPSEIELLIEGSDEPLDIPALRAITRYKHWTPPYVDPNNALVIRWFWRYIESLDPTGQRKLLMFATGSDRVPATGISTMSFTITRLGGDCDRFPISHTCFNELCLYEYRSKSKLIEMLSRAVNESEGFGLK